MALFGIKEAAWDLAFFSISSVFQNFHLFPKKMGSDLERVESDPASSSESDPLWGESDPARVLESVLAAGGIGSSRFASDPARRFAWDPDFGHVPHFRHLPHVFIYIACP